jgi:hypothetical protein
MVRVGRLIMVIIYMKGKKMVTEASREQKRTLRIAESPKKVTKLKLGSMLEASKQRELEQINEAIREKLDHGPQTATSVPPPYPDEGRLQSLRGHLPERPGVLAGVQLVDGAVRAGGYQPQVALLLHCPAAGGARLISTHSRMQKASVPVL